MQLRRQGGQKYGRLHEQCEDEGVSELQDNHAVLERPGDGSDRHVTHFP